MKRPDIVQRAYARTAARLARDRQEHAREMRRQRDEPNIICKWCLRPTRKRPRSGRTTVRHKCSHGTWCPRADPLRQHDNHYPIGGRNWCRSCHEAYWARERVTRDR